MSNEAYYALMKSYTAATFSCSFTCPKCNWGNRGTLFTYTATNYDGDYKIEARCENCDQLVLLAGDPFDV